MRTQRGGPTGSCVDGCGRPAATCMDSLAGQATHARITGRGSRHEACWRRHTPPDQPAALSIVAHAYIVNPVCSQVKPHLFTHTKHRIAQLNTLLSQRQQ